MTSWEEIHYMGESQSKHCVKLNTRHSNVVLDRNLPRCPFKWLNCSLALHTATWANTKLHTYPNWLALIQSLTYSICTHTHALQILQACALWTMTAVASLIDRVWKSGSSAGSHGPQRYFATTVRFSPALATTAHLCSTRCLSHAVMFSASQLPVSGV